MKKSVEKLDMTTLLNHLIFLGYPVYAIASEERWLECDNQEDIRLYERLYPNGGKSMVDLHLHTTASDGQYPRNRLSEWRMSAASPFWRLQTMTA